MWEAAMRSYTLPSKALLMPSTALVQVRGHRRLQFRPLLCFFWIDGAENAHLFIDIEAEKNIISQSSYSNFSVNGYSTKSEKNIAEESAKSCIGQLCQGQPFLHVHVKKKGGPCVFLAYQRQDDPLAGSIQ